MSFSFSVRAMDFKGPRDVPNDYGAEKRLIGQIDKVQWLLQTLNEENSFILR